MAYVVYVDMSAKSEQWSKDSAVAMANGKSKAIWVPARVKQYLRQALVDQYGGKSLEYRVMAILVYFVVRDDLKNISQIVIDRDYTGEQIEATIRNLLLNLLRHDLPNINAKYIRFDNIAGSKADKLARRVYEGKASYESVVTIAELETVLRR